ncbi:MAG: arsenate reductase ArsC [Chloroflexi bacterium]|nr:arsenate reductase ArsC [Chloroflexota bacterium]
MADVLFVCVHNAGRSQMAKALFNHEAQQRGLPYRADSAGTEPGLGVHREVAQVMREIGLDLSGELPKLIDNDMVKSARKVVTMGCQVDADKCPAVFIKGVEDWGLPDPKGRPLQEVRAIRDTVRRRVSSLLAELAAARQA